MSEIRMSIIPERGVLPHESAFTHTDGDGDRLLISTAVLDSDGSPGIYFRTDHRGSTLPLTELPRLIRQLSIIAEAAKEAAKGKADES